jgi:hypothetical protein
MSLGAGSCKNIQGKGERGRRDRKPQKLGMTVTRHNAINASNSMQVSSSPIRDWGVRFGKTPAHALVPSVTTRAVQ